MTQLVSLGEQIRRRREEIALGQSDAARKAGVGRTTWLGWEKRGVTPERHRYVLIERALKWEPGSVEAVLEGGQPQPARTEHGPPGRLPIDPEALARYHPADREAILAVVRAAEARAAQRHPEEGKRLKGA